VCKSWAGLQSGKSGVFLTFHHELVRGLACVREPGIVPRAMVEPGFVTLAKIVGTLLLCMGIIPFLFLLAPGDRTEPKDTFDGD
jgi:hypothetical protein